MTLDEAVDWFRDSPSEVTAAALRATAKQYLDDGMIEQGTFDAYITELSEAGF